VWSSPVDDRSHRNHTNTSHANTYHASWTQTHSFVPVQPPKHETFRRLDPSCLGRKPETFGTSRFLTVKGNGTGSSTWYLSLRTGQHSRRLVPSQASPSLSEIETCRTFQVSDPDNWDPTSEMFRVSAVGRGQMSVSVSNSRDLCLYDLCLCDFYDFDHLQESPTHDIAQIRTSQRHHGVDANLLSLKWGIGLQKAKDTLKHTTKPILCSSVSYVSVCP
jgi:hypothetical protein